MMKNIKELEKTINWDFYRNLTSRDIWNNISKSSTLLSNEEFVYEFTEKLNWYLICKFQKNLSEKIIIRCFKRLFDNNFEHFKTSIDLYIFVLKERHIFISREGWKIINELQACC